MRIQLRAMWVFVAIALAAPSFAQTPVTFPQSAPVQIDTATVGKLNSIRFVDGVKFSTVAAAIADLPSAGGIVVSTITETFSADPFAGKESVMLVLGAGTWQTNTQVKVPGGSRIVGAARQHGSAAGTTIKAGSSFPSNTAVVRLGTGGGRVQGARLDGLTIDGNNATGVSGVYSNEANELSGLQNVLVIGIKDKGVHFDNSGGLCENWNIDGLEANILAGTSTTVGLKVSGSTQTARIQNVTINMSFSSGVADAIQHDGFTGSLKDVRVEAATNGIHIGQTTASVGVLIYNISGNTNVTNLVRISSATGTTKVSVLGWHTLGGTNAVKDDAHSTTITDGQGGFYFVGDGGPATLLTSAANATNRLRAELVVEQTAYAKRIKANQGTPLASNGSDFSLHANWGSGASAGTVVGTDQGFEATVTSGSSGTGANPTLTLTFKDGTWTSSPVASCGWKAGGTGTLQHLSWTAAASTLVITYNGTPGTGQTFPISCVLMGR